ncbi:hypothetical protein [Photobacterium leiognathi]|uniref:hypothetical protein n=1 Tax=Photobacterium leiognathi TaxID=553611 RepID=UPI00298110B1|nr:hypothetical protein [Photobacterium leiognathi]
MQLISDLFPFLNGLVQEGNYVTIVLIVLFTIVINLKNIFNFVNEFKKNRLSNIESALSDDRLPSNMKYQLTSELSIEYFSLIYGVRLSTPMINAILLLNERIKQRVAFRHLIIISKLTPNIRGIEHDSYRVKLDKFDYIPLIYNALLGIAILSLGLLIFILCLISSFQETHFSIVLLSMFFMLVGVLLLREARAFLSIHYINDALNLYQKSNN